MVLKKIKPLLIVYWLITSAIFLLLAFIISQHSFKFEINKQLKNQLAPQLTKAFQQHMFDKNYKALVKNNINQQLALTKKKKYLSAIMHYSLLIDELFSESSQTNLHTLYVQWNFGLKPVKAKLSLNYQINWVLLTLTSCVLALITILSLFLIPKPTSSSYKYWLLTLQKLQINNELAKRLSHQLEYLNETQSQWINSLLSSFLERKNIPQHIQISALISWFINKQAQAFNNLSVDKFVAAIMQPHLNFEQGYELAQKENTLTFNMTTFSVSANGFEIKLAKTPFFYYLWYAYLKVNNLHSGWLINPSANSPDHQSAKNILALMKNNQGHSKSINELETHGLRAKTLDQNRNKIKDSFIEQLGETLSQPYLFELLRDTRTGRFQYRVKLNPEKIKLSQKNLINLKKI